VLHVGLHARIAFAACWIAGQAALIATSPLRPDHIFGFRMFPEASTIEVHLTREVGGRVVRVAHGEWTALDRAGSTHEFSWHERVRDRVLTSLDSRVFASYGVDAQLARLKLALDDVADHIPEDAETSRLGAEVVVWKNGHEPANVVLFSRARSEL
jgi:hypothetical protein